MLGPAILVGAAVAGAWLAGTAGARRLVSETLVAPIAGAPELAGLEILHISDTHIGSARDWAVRALGRLSTVEADIVAVTGDIIDSPAGLAVAAEAVGGLRSRLATIVVPGNHDHWHGRHIDRITGRIRPFVAPRAFAAAFAARGAVPLVNRSIRLRAPAGEIVVAGLDDPYFMLDDPAKAFDGVDGRCAALVLGHSPDAAFGLRGRRCDLFLCGHTHGGQILGLGGSPPQFTNTRNPVPATFGLMLHAGVLTHVSAGLGTAVVPLRFNCPPRATLLRIVAL